MTEKVGFSQKNGDLVCFRFAEYNILLGTLIDTDS
jgi:hypothetical protein